MNVERYASFADGSVGGNPAGVVICDALPDAAAMQRIAAEVGYSETVFAVPEGAEWRVRYFAPAMEVPFCGHATVALGAALATHFGGGVFRLQLNDGVASVEGQIQGAVATATLCSPPAHSRAVAPDYLAACLALFGYGTADLDARLPPAIISAGANHLLLALTSRQRLATMAYDFERGQRLMATEDLATISLVFAETPQLFHARNPFAVGGVYEDPATGAAAAALGGYLREIGWPHGGAVTIVQGEDMGMPSRLFVEISNVAGDGVRVGGSVRPL